MPTSRQPEPLRVALLSYRGNPYVGGQGVYVRNLSRELVRAGHDVTVLAGQPYPDVDDRVGLVQLPGLDLYAEPHPFRPPLPTEIRTFADLVELGVFSVAGFPEPLAFSLRARRWLVGHADEYDVIHDNQGLGYGMLGLPRPLVATIHHPITVDRRVELAAASWLRRLSLRRWYGFVRMQARVARQMSHVITVSTASRAGLVDELGVDPARLHTVPVGIDPATFAPPATVARVPGRIVTTASADVPMKGLAHLLEAVAKLRTEREVELVVVGRARPGGPAEAAIGRLGLHDAVRFVSGIPDHELAGLLGSASVAVVPSLYEGFSLPAIEAMACGTPLVATTGGALPEVVGADGDTGLLVEPGDAGALALAIGRVLDDPALAAQLGERGRARVLERFTWAAAAAATADVYREAIATC